MEVDSVAEEDKWMLEVDVQHLFFYSLSETQHWIHAVEAVQQGSTHAVELSKGTTNKWDAIMKDGRFDHLLTSTPIPTDTSTAAVSAAKRSNTS